jgi:hypothetical protein
MRIYQSGRLNRTIGILETSLEPAPKDAQVGETTFTLDWPGLWNFRSSGVPQTGHRSSWTPSSYLQVNPEGYDLVLIQERRAFERRAKSGAHNLELALLVESPIVALLYRLDDEGWKHLYYVLPLARDQGSARAFIEQPWSDRRSARIRVRLVDPFERQALLDQSAQLDPEFSGILHRALRDQADTAFDPANYVRTVTLLSLSHPTPATLHDRAQARMTLPI